MSLITFIALYYTIGKSAQYSTVWSKRPRTSSTATETPRRALSCGYQSDLSARHTLYASLFNHELSIPAVHSAAQRTRPMFTSHIHHGSIACLLAIYLHFTQVWHPPSDLWWERLREVLLCSRLITVNLIAGSLFLLFQSTLVVIASFINHSEIIQYDICTSASTELFRVYFEQIFVYIRTKMQPSFIIVYTSEQKGKMSAKER